MANVCYSNHRRVPCPTKLLFFLEAGAGKSTLLYVISIWARFESLILSSRSAVVQEIEGKHAAGLATMAYYYFDFRDVKKQDCYGLLSSLISQLSAESDSCYN